MLDVKRLFILFLSVILTLITADTALSQPTGQGGDQAQMGQQGGRGQMGQGQQPEQMQNSITQRLKEMLGSTDEEWTIVGPKVLKVYTLVSSQLRGLQIRSLMGNLRQGDTQRGGINSQSSSSEDKMLQELQTLLESEETTSTQIKTKVSEVRKEKERSKQELAKAQKELRELLTLKQEAILISIGLLE